MTTFRSLTSISLVLTSAVMFGCGQSEQANVSESPEDAQLMKELFGELEQNSDGTSADPRKSGSVVPVARATGGGALELNLNEGDRFPLVKIVEQSLIQKPEQFAASAQTKLELHMAIEVQQVAADGILMRVEYSRVIYEHDVNGHRMAYDSDTHQNAIPEDVIPYAGMVKNGFAFWLSRDNTIRELVDYPQFLERCVAGIPVEKRQRLLADISARFGDDGVANFVDDAIGLLPFDSTVDPESATHVGPGDVWTRERRLMLPVPVYMTSTCRLVALNDSTAEIDITGRIAPGETYHDVRGDQSARVRIKGGQSYGSCTVDRATGLPLNLRRTRYLQMSVSTQDGATVEQDKRVVTTIRAFPTARGPVVQQRPGSVPVSMSAPLQNTANRSGVQPAGAQQTGSPAPSGAIQIPTQGSGSTTRAVYPD